jgi:D-beta-D-heptose 7-phosphate kinase/D-beta-D-heptose 1-phosphate adenosyltransferase
LVVGDIMMDRLLRGSADRISPEAPVPVVHVNHESFTPGGAGNVANNLVVLGAHPTLLGVRGDDKTGDELERDLADRGINVAHLVVDTDRPTITKNRVFVGHQQVARYDIEKKHALPSPIHASLLEKLRRIVAAQKAIVISDYGKGVVTQKLIQFCLGLARRQGIPVVVDPKIEHFKSYKGVDCITPNTKEAVDGMRVGAPGSEAEMLALGDKILKTLRSRSLLITRGEKGMTLFEKGAKPVTIPALAQEVYDVTGAGDTVVSTFALARAVGAPHLVAAVIANIAASLVVAKVGTAVATREELIQRVKKLR